MDDAPSMYLTRRIYLRALGLVCLLAFGSLWWQIPGLIGPEGIVPLGDHLAALKAQIRPVAWTGIPELDRFLAHPTLSWFLPASISPYILATAGTCASLAVMFRKYPGPALGIVWLTYLSLSLDGHVFMTFQWDTLLVEVAFASMLIAPWLREDEPSESPRWGWWILRWILFRLVFFAGVVKLMSGDETWRGLSAMSFHYETQPLPNPVSWWMHSLPDWAHSLEVVVMFIIELGLAWLILGPRRWRALAFWSVIALMVMLAVTGNYGFFQLLTMVLALTLLDDDHWIAAVPGKYRDRFRPPTLYLPSNLAQGLTAITALVLLSTSLVGLTQRYLAQQVPLHPHITTWQRSVQPFRTVNQYGLFARMTTTRPIPVLEVKWGDGDWTELTWRWQTSDPKAAPAQVAPHMPRVDWRLWFAGLGTCKQNPWATTMLQRITEGSEDVSDLIGDLRLAQRAPTAARLMLYEYTFTEPESDEAKSGAWWTRTAKGVYCQAVKKR